MHGYTDVMYNSMLFYTYVYIYEWSRAIGQGEAYI